LIESVVFPELEREVLKEMDELIYSEHLATMNALTGDDFGEERRVARGVYNRLGRRMMPWGRWAPEKTPVDMWNEAQERRKDPTYMAKIQQLQSELDGRAETLKAAVQTELEIRKAAQKDREERAAAEKRTAGRHYASRVPWRSRSIR
jgi:hypothetical protein